MNKMKLYVFWGTLILVVGINASCDRDYLAYEQEKDRIYFMPGSDIGTTTTIFEDWENSDTKQVAANFYVMGFPSPELRKINLEIVDTLTDAVEGQDYILEKELVMPVNEVSAYIPVITWKRRKEGDTRPDHLQVGLRLVENNHYLPTMSDTRIFLYNKTVPQKPWYWKEVVLGPWSPGLMYKIIEQYRSLKTTNVDVYNSIHRFMGDNFQASYWPSAVEYLVIKYVVTPVYYYYEEHPEPGVVVIPKPIYE